MKGNMKEILSQAEIDSLLAALSTGRVKVEDLKETKRETGYKSYDFRRPNKFSKEHLRKLETLHDGFARRISSFLSGYLRSPIIVRVASVDSFTFDDFIRSVPSPTLLTVFTLKPLKGAAIMETNPQFVFPLLDLLFGGPGEMPKKVRDLTDIELSVIKKLNIKILENLSEAWADVYSVTPEIESLEVNPRMHQIISLNEIVAVITFTTVIGGTIRGLLNLCLPHVVLMPVLNQLSSYYRYTHDISPSGGEEAKFLEYWLLKAPVELKAIAGNASITVSDFLQLQAGDVLPLNCKIEQDFDLYINDRLKFKIQPGTVGYQMAVQITSLVNEGSCMCDEPTSASGRDRCAS